MALWDDLLADVNVITGRSDLPNETTIALRNAIRSAHKAGKFYRDLVKVTWNAGVATTPVQTVDLSSILTGWRQLAYVKSGSRDQYYKEVHVEDLVDEDGYVRQDRYWVMGATLNLRAAYQETSYEIAYWKMPPVPYTNPAGTYTSDWIADDYRDSIILFAAATVLGIVGEQEIKTRIEGLAALARADLIEDNIEATGR